MKIKTYTKKDIANEFSRRRNQSVRKSIEDTDTLFNILRDILIEDNPYTRIEIRNFGVLESKYVLYPIGYLTDLLLPSGYLAFKISL